MKDFWPSRAIQIHAIATFWGWLLDLASRAHCSLGDDMWSVFKCKLLCRFQFLHVDNKSLKITELPRRADNTMLITLLGSYFTITQANGELSLPWFLCCGPGSLNYTKFCFFLMLASSVFSHSWLPEKAAAHLFSRLFFLETMNDGCFCFGSS